jgi:hypothetical protein
LSIVKIRFWLPGQFFVARFRRVSKKMLPPEGTEESVSLRRGVCQRALGREPAHGRLTPLSVIAALKKLSSH